MIYTLTLNPALDYFISFEKFQEGELNTPTDSYKLAGGKGINISKVLKNFSTESTALGFVGGFTGDFIKNSLISDNINENFVEIEEDSRINLKINNNGIETEVSGNSPKISEEKVKELLNYLKDNLKEGDILALSGSVPDSISDDIYSQIIKNLPKDVKIVLDSRGIPFKKAISEGVFLVKPNQNELTEFFNERFSTDIELIEAGKKLQSLGAENVIISLGKNGSILITKNGVFRANAPKGELISSNGAGDSMLAGFIYGLSKQLPLEECYKIAVAAGSGTAFSKGLTSFEMMNKLLREINILEI